MSDDVGSAGKDGPDSIFVGAADFDTVSAVGRWAARGVQSDRVAGDLGPFDHASLQHDPGLDIGRNDVAGTRGASADHVINDRSGLTNRGGKEIDGIEHDADAIADFFGSRHADPDMIPFDAVAG